MKNKPTSFFSSGTFMFFWMLLVLPSTQYLFAQQINPKILEFYRICAGGPHPTKPGEVYNDISFFLYKWFSFG